jgi:hypothetical protein
MTRPGFIHRWEQDLKGRADFRNLDDTFLQTLKMLSPGSMLQTGLENILRARTGGLLVVGDYPEVPPHSTVVGVPGRVVRENGHKVTERTELDHANLPDPVEAAFRKIVARVNALEQQVRELQQERNALGETQLAEERR